MVFSSLLNVFLRINVRKKKLQSLLKMPKTKRLEKNLVNPYNTERMLHHISCGKCIKGSTHYLVVEQEFDVF